MAEEFRIWRIGDKHDAHLLTKAPRMDTERDLEDILVRNPELLGDGVALVGRQIRTESGPLDLLGVTSDGTLVVYELKRGGTPRDAITQALDYASGLDEMSDVELADHVTTHSGKDGIPEIDDFANWYADHSSNGDLSRRGRTAVCCVGIGVDDATLRIAKWLRRADVDISIIEFAAYQRAGEQLLARYVELEDAGSPAKAAQDRAPVDPRNRALERDALQQFDEAVTVLRNCFKPVTPHEYPHKNLLRFWFPQAADDGDRVRQMNVAGVCVRTDQGAIGQIYLVVYDRIAQSLPKEFETMSNVLEKAGIVKRSTSHKDWHAFHISSSDEIEAAQPSLCQFLSAVVSRFNDGTL